MKKVGQTLSDVTALATAMSVSDWFFTRNKYLYIPRPLHMYGTVLRLHLGTAAFGALVHSFTDGPHRVVSKITDERKNEARSGELINPALSWSLA